MVRASLSLSVVLATHDPRGPDLRRCLSALCPQLAALGGELLIADGSAQATPNSDHAVHLPGADVFALRCAAVRRAGGAIVALTEDHCVPAPDWCSAMLRAHREHPHTAAIGGTTLNGSDARLIDSANFFVTFGPFLPPLPRRHPTRTVPPANLSIKRVALNDYELTPGLLELEIAPHLHRVGHLLLDDRIRVAHFQSHSASETLGLHFHNGRSTISVPHRERPRSEIARRAAQSLSLPLRLATELVRTLARKPGHRRRAAMAAPWMLTLLAAHAAGEVVGGVAGPGDSPARLH